MAEFYPASLTSKTLPSLGFYARAFSFSVSLGSNFSEALQAPQLDKGIQLAAKPASKHSNISAARCVSILGLPY